MSSAMRVHPLGDTRRHYWLAQRMAKETGTDLVAAFDRGLLTPRGWAAMVDRCRGCQWDGCEAWLARQDNDAAAVPKACPNEAVLERLKAQVD